MTTDALSAPAIDDRSFIKIIGRHVMCGQRRNDGHRLDAGQMTVTTSIDEQCPSVRSTEPQRSAPARAACLPLAGSDRRRDDNLCPHCVPTSLVAVLRASISLSSPASTTITDNIRRTPD